MPEKKQNGAVNKRKCPYSEAPSSLDKTLIWPHHPIKVKCHFCLKRVTTIVTQRISCLQCSIFFIILMFASLLWMTSDSPIYMIFVCSPCIVFGMNKRVHVCPCCHKKIGAQVPLGCCPPDRNSLNGTLAAVEDATCGDNCLDHNLERIGGCFICCFPRCADGLCHCVA